MQMIGVPKALREQGQALMELFLAIQHYICNDLYRLNLCRLCLQAKFLSGILSPEGNNILPEIGQGRRQHDSTSDVLWPKQAGPFEKSWALWRGPLKLASQGQKSSEPTKQAPPYP